ncbi:SpoIIE family protein phosphatase [Streptomyces mirabilis]|uniref:SpoIIE family protein phosphatase n=1 Tax=Streptomyces mirabilis TaxID=68239 RepID=UPI00367F59AE
MIHLADPDERLLRLASAEGIPLDVLEDWRTTDRNGESAPALALRDNMTVWLSAAEPGTGLPAFGTGMAATSMSVVGGCIETLSVVTASPDPPAAAQRDIFEAVALWATEWLRWPTRSSGSGDPTEWRRPSRSDRVAGVGAWDWNVRTGEVVGDESLAVILGIDQGVCDTSVEDWAAVVHPDDLLRAMSDVTEAFVTCRPYSADYRLRRPDGAERWVQVHGRVILGEDHRPTHVGGVLWDTTEPTTWAESATRELRHMADGFVTTDQDWHITYVNIQAERLLGTSESCYGTSLWDLPSVRSSGPGLEADCRRAAVEGVPADLDVQWLTDERWYRVRITPSPDGHVLHFADVTDKRLLDAERLQSQQAAAERTDLIGQLTQALAKAVTVRDVAHAVAAGVRPPFGAVGVVVQIIDGEYLRVVEAVGYPPEFVERVGRTHVSDRTANADAFRDRAPVYLTSRQDFIRHYPQYADHATRGGKQAWAFLPLIVSGRPLGCCVISFSQPHRFTEEERSLLATVSGLIAQALARARLYDSEHRRATELQRGLLPRALPELRATATAARYLPTGSGVGVGGDWYDVIPLSADRVAFVIGDVMGHGLSEAATMGRLRTAVRTLASLELPLDELLAQLNDLVSDLGDDFYATCLCALYDPVTGVCTLVRAGHPPPALLLPDGTVTFPDLPLEPPLGAASPPFETAELNLPDGSILVLYTDGLVESAARDIDTGMAQLAAALTAAHGALSNGRQPGSLCDVLVTSMLPGQETNDDDAAVLVARANRFPADAAASWDLPEGPVAAGEARKHVRHTLSEWHLDDLAMATELIASELVGNGIRHARGPFRLRLVRGGVLTCEVSDHSLTTPRVRRARDTDEGGRGLQLVAAVSQRWGARYTSDGKCIWAEQALPAE